TRSCEAGDEPTADRICNRNEDNGNRRGRFFGGENTGRRGSNDDIRFKTDKLFRQGRETVKLSPCISVLDDNILSFNVTKLIEHLPECVDANPVKGRGLTTEKSYPRNFFWLLSLGERNSCQKDSCH